MRMTRAAKIIVSRIDSNQLLDAYLIREKVFVEEQHVPQEEEIDSFENTSTHYLAKNEEGIALGTARWRRTEHGIKLERFAVLKEFRKAGAGSKLVEAVLEDVRKELLAEGESIYLHSQIDAMPLYEKFGFVKQGKKFDECGIMHYKMVLKA